MHISRDIYNFLDRHYSGQFTAVPVTPAAWYYEISGPSTIINAARLAEFTTDIKTVSRILAGEHRRIAFTSLYSEFRDLQRNKVKAFISSELAREKEFYRRAREIKKLKLKDIVAVETVQTTFDLCHVSIPCTQSTVTTKTGFFKYLLPVEEQ